MPSRLAWLQAAAAPTLLQRLLRVLTVGGCALVFALAGALACWATLVHITGERLGAYTTMLLQQAQGLDDEARASIDRFDRQPGAFCSAAEFEQMREVVYRTYYVKDVGRVRDGRLVCTAGLQHVVDPPAVRAPDIVTAGGYGIAVADLQLLARGSRAPVIGRGEANVVLDPEAFRLLPSPDVQYTIGYVGTDGTFLPLYGARLPLATSQLRAGSVLDQAGVLSRPACDPVRDLCVASALPKTALFAAQWPLLLVSTLLGAFAGGAIGVALLLWHLRGQTLEARLLRAIDEDALDVEYQPVVRVDDGTIVGAEALVRWRDTDGRWVPPVRFIPLAEDNGSIGRITRFVVKRVVRDFGDLLAAPGTFRISVNISAADLDDPEFHAALADTLGAAGIASDRLGIELTEHSTAARDTAVAGTSRLRALGHLVYIDDFGTGYSSLAYLTQLDVHALKIDRSFTHTIATDAVKVTLVPQIIELARTLGLQVVIEGVETPEQLAWLRRVDYPMFAQGWLFGRPMTADAFRARLDAPHAARH